MVNHVEPAMSIISKYNCKYLTIHNSTWACFCHPCNGKYRVLQLDNTLKLTHFLPMYELKTKLPAQRTATNIPGKWFILCMHLNNLSVICLQIPVTVNFDIFNC